MSQALTPEWGMDLENSGQTTSRPDFLLPKWDRLAELNSFTGRSKHPGSKPRFAHRHQSWQMEPRRLVAEQAVILPETQVPPIIEGVEAINSPLMAAVFFSALANNEFVKKNGPRLAVIALALALTTCLPQQSTPAPEIPPAVVVVTNTPLPDLGLTQPTATLTATPTETPFFGGGGPELPGGSPDQIRALLESGMPLPATDCVTAPESGGDQTSWDGWIKTLTEQRANPAAIADLQSKINAKLAAWGISDSTTLELCGGGDGGYSFAVRDNSSGLLWWSFDLEENRFADRPDRVFDHDWQFKPMPREGLKSGLEVVILMINGWPLAVSVDPAGHRPIQYFDPVLGEFINFYPDTPTPTRTASAIPTITNTPRPTAIPATAAPKPSPTFTLEPSPPPTPQPEGFISTRDILPTREELIRCSTGVKLSLREVDKIDTLTGKPFHHYRNKVISNSGGVLTFEGGRVENINGFAQALLLQVSVDDPENQYLYIGYWGKYSVNDFVQLIKSGDYVALNWDSGIPNEVMLYCNSR